MQYRFGTVGKLEFEFPKMQSDTQKSFTYSRYTRPLVTRLTLTFENAGFIYEIHDDDESDVEPPVQYASIDITNSESRDISTIDCKWPTTGSLIKLEDIVLGDEDN
ncbi:MAG: hypothetical protein ACRESZ_12470 [Methylococcales bacterium]